MRRLPEFRCLQREMQRLPKPVQHKITFFRRFPEKGEQNGITIPPKFPTLRVPTGNGGNSVCAKKPGHSCDRAFFQCAADYPLGVPQYSQNFPCVCAVQAGQTHSAVSIAGAAGEVEAPGVTAAAAALPAGSSTQSISAFTGRTP